MIINWGDGHDYFGEFREYSLGSEVNTDDVIHYISGETIRNNRISVYCGGTILRKSFGVNTYSDTTPILNSRFDEVRYYRPVR